MSKGQMNYNVVDSKTNQIVAASATRKGATRIADRLDTQYGAVRYIVTFR
jgi:hypothetical protein